MRTINIVCVGSLKEKYLRDAAAEYEKRLSPYCKLKITEVSEYKLPEKPSSAEIARCIEAEGNAVLAKIPQNAAIAAMCIEGEMLSSEDFSKRLSALMSNEAASELCFVIGGSYGLYDEVKKESRPSAFPLKNDLYSSNLPCFDFGAALPCIPNFLRRKIS